MAQTLPLAHEQWHQCRLECVMTQAIVITTLHGLWVLDNRWMSEWEFDSMYFVLHARCSILTQQFNVLKKLIYNNVSWY